MIYLCRIFWLLSFIPIVILYMVIFIIGTLIYPVISALYYIVTGSTDNCIEPYVINDYINKKYFELRDKFENKYGK